MGKSFYRKYRLKFITIYFPNKTLVTMEIFGKTFVTKKNSTNSKNISSKFKERWARYVRKNSAYYLQKNPSKKEHEYTLYDIAFPTFFK